MLPKEHGQWWHGMADLRHIVPSLFGYTSRIGKDDGFIFGGNSVRSRGESVLMWQIFVSWRGVNAMGRWQ